MRITFYRTNNPKIVGITFILFSVIFLIIGTCVSIAPKVKSKRCTGLVKADVIENIQSESRRKSGNGRRRDSTLYAPVFQFDYNGKKYTVKSSTSSDPPAYEVGDVVKLKINPDDPTDFYAPSDKTLNMIGIIFLIIGAFQLSFGAASVILSRKKNKDLSA